jgi:2-polyprenyl-6-hydroxyphenyl methylase/3-demethylubiquinone-9 3-methyltransferase
MEMLEHVPDPASVVACLRQAREARADGWFLHHQPQPEVVPLRDRGRGVCPAASCRVARTSTRASSRHRSSRAIRARRASRSSDLTGMIYNPLTRVYSLGRDVDVNYLLATRK